MRSKFCRRPNAYRQARKVWMLALLPLAIAAPASAGILDNPIPTPIAKSPISVELQSIAGGLVAPNYITHAGDGTDRLFIVDQPGQIRLFTGGTLAPAPFLDLSSRLVPLGGLFGGPFSTYDERGFLGLAFHPEFDNPNSAGFGRFYTYTSEPYLPGAADYTVNLQPGESFDHQSVVAEWRINVNDPNVADPSSRRELLRFDQPQFNHNGGALTFGPDGNLYISSGDGGNADDEGPGHGLHGNAQDLVGNVLGKILRIDVEGHDSANGEYGIPANNPFVDEAGVPDEIYAYGFRNPYRIGFDMLTGELIVADVGQNDIEEINVATAGGNFGWNLKEGTFKFVGGNDPAPGEVSDDLTGLPPGLIDPVAQYDHDEGLSIIGGFVYRGDAIPALQGKYVFGDFSRSFFAPQGRLFAADLGTGLIEELTIGLDDRLLGYFVKGVGQDAQGEIYFAVSRLLGVAGDTGEILRLTAVPLPAAVWLLGSAFGACLLRRRVAATACTRAG